MELFQSGLLVHDDIMDRDATRRGQPTIHRQYAGEAEQRGARDPEHLGQSLGICAGDAAFFLGFEVLAAPPVPEQARAGLLRLCARELSWVAVAQMQDVAWGAQPAFGGAGPDPASRRGSPAPVHLQDRPAIPSPCRLPPAPCWPAAGRKPLAALERLGSAWASCSSSATTCWIFSATSGSWASPWARTCARARRRCCTGGSWPAPPRPRPTGCGTSSAIPHIGEAELDFVRRQSEGLGVLAEVQELAAGYAAEARRLIEGLPRARAEEQRVLFELLRYTSERTR